VPSEKIAKTVCQTNSSNIAEGSLDDSVHFYPKGKTWFDYRVGREE
jgi:hypothetical protein